MSSDLRSLDRRFLGAAEILVRVAQEAGLNVRVTSTRRSRTKQAALYRAYLRGESKLPALPPGKSLHEHGLAVDLVVMDRHGRRDDAALAELGAVWESWGGQWGGKPDPVHFQAKQLLR